jgi:hypothetical protein
LEASYFIYITLRRNLFWGAYACSSTQKLLLFSNCEILAKYLVLMCDVGFDLQLCMVIHISLVKENGAHGKSESRGEKST